MSKSLFRAALVLLWLPVLTLATPSLSLPDLNGKTHNVNEYIGQGRWVVMVIWAHDCPICNAEIHQMLFFNDAHRDRDAMVLGISIDGAAKIEQARNFVETHSLDFLNLITEPDGIALRALGAGPLYGTPTFYVFEPEGELVAQQIGPLTQERLEEFIVRYNRKIEARRAAKEDAAYRAATGAGDAGPGTANSPPDRGTQPANR